MQRFSQCALNAPAAMQSLPNDQRFQAHFSAPHGERLGLAVQGREVITTGIVVLNDTKRPSAIRRAVVPAVVDPINGMRWARARTHVGQERREIDPPSLTHGDALCAVIPEGFRSGVVAPFLDAAPDSVFRRAARTMRGQAIRVEFDFQTSTAFRQTSNQVWKMDDADRSALALAEDRITAVAQKSKAPRDGPSPMCLSDPTGIFRHA